MTAGPALPIAHAADETAALMLQRLADRPQRALPDHALSALADWVEFRARQLYPDRFAAPETPGEE